MGLTETDVKQKPSFSNAHVRANKMSKPKYAHKCMKVFDIHRMCICWFRYFICEINLFVLNEIQAEQKPAAERMVHFRKCVGKTVKG